ncbi:saccharopine dehydrogenase [Cokeromyces recurvatus]|uniref:saccharopine dehydrogenase n=1 Tax=Cokeromyces recurvatus TaxID=90255 RepID=UPI00221E6DE2|nr:saccharopine dehydrogenase [Cokeromyces recurvatus]KAI7902872.1 saccharopine dehydrogenase [Cokeromyces recurvatus]
MVDKKILLLGSGFVAAPCVDYLVRRPENKVTIASRRLANAQALSNQFPGTVAVSCDINDEEAIEKLVSEHDIAISLIPYIHHAKVIKAAVKHKKHVVTTSYISPAMLEYDQAAKDAGITVMNEIGLDPGIDHLYAIKTIEEVHNEGGKLKEFISFCGGLPAPEDSNNPFGYKFSWSARGVLLALKNTARYLEKGKVVEVSGTALMDSAKKLNTGYPGFAFVGYGNRDSTHYDERYHIPEAETIIRGTIRYDGFCQFVKVLITLGFLSEEEEAYLDANAQDNITWNQILAKILNIHDTSAEALQAAVIQKCDLDHNDHKAQILDGMRWLGFFSNAQAQRRGTLLDTFCATLEEKMQYGENERDLVFLQHRFEIELKDGRHQTRTSTLVEYGKVGGFTAMAKTVGVPCGIATQLILDNQLTATGVLAPMSHAINQPIIELLEQEGIGMVERIL